MNCVEGGILGSDRKAYSPKCLGLSSGGAGGWDRRCALRLATATTPLSASRSTVGEAADAGEVYVVQVRKVGAGEEEVRAGPFKLAPAEADGSERSVSFLKRGGQAR